MASKNNQVGKKGFAYGWGLQVLVAIMFFFYAGISIDGLNVSVPAFASENGWDYASILILSTPAGLAGLVGIFSFSHIASKKGPKAIIITCFNATTRLPSSISITSSIRRKGSLWGIISLICSLFNNTYSLLNHLLPTFTFCRNCIFSSSLR
jgi:hypothetical protein